MEKKEKITFLHTGYEADFTNNDRLNIIKKLGIDDIIIEKIKKSNIIVAVHYFKSTNQDMLKAWYNSKLHNEHFGYLTGCYINKKKTQIVAQVTIDGKALFINLYNDTNEKPIDLKTDVSSGRMGNKFNIEPKIKFSCKPYIS